MNDANPPSLSDRWNRKWLLYYDSNFLSFTYNRKRIFRQVLLGSSRTFPFVTSPLKRYTRATRTWRSIGIAEVTDLLCRLAGNALPLLCLGLPCRCFCLVPKKSALILSPLTRRLSVTFVKNHKMQAIRATVSIVRPRVFLYTIEINFPTSVRSFLFKKNGMKSKEYLSAYEMQLTGCIERGMMHNARREI